eukprot:TRINITY_DN2095_c0_g1_i3.p1 TRINITY_DN2095_c0_g1~~TRINITY_DN2095_c0_g1_i3.p1  ORF type:complete len:151 (-),score=85.10 TRINITY_DN2095_c0_g1_i3:52-504(-)
MRAAAAAVAAHEQLDLTPGVTTREDRLRAEFVLPSSETILADFTSRCASLPGNLGKMYLTTSHLCYEVRWGNDDEEATPHTLVLELDNVLSVRVKKGWVTSELFVTAFDSKGVAMEIEFNRMPHGQKAARLLVEQAAALGHTIEVLGNDD